MSLQHGDGAAVDRQPAHPVGLGVLLDDPNLAVHDGSFNTQRAGDDIDIAPAQAAHLAPSHARGDEDSQRDPEVGRAGRGGGRDQAQDLVRGRRPDPPAPQPGRTGRVSRVGGQPSPAHSLTQRRVQHPVMAVDGRGLAAGCEKVSVELVEVDSREVVELSVPDDRQQLTDDGPVADHRRHLEPSLGVRQPRLEELAYGAHAPLPRLRAHGGGQHHHRPPL